MSPSVIISLFSVLVGVVLGAIALGMVGGAPAVLGFLAGVFILAGLLMPNVIPEAPAPAEAVEAEVTE